MVKIGDKVKISYLGGVYAGEVMLIRKKGNVEKKALIKFKNAGGYGVNISLPIIDGAIYQNGVKV